MSLFILQTKRAKNLSGLLLSSHYKLTEARLELPARSHDLSFHEKEYSSEQYVRSISTSPPSSTSDFFRTHVICF